jgi:P27 family predicted phage terminase small subunit
VAWGRLVAAVATYEAEGLTLVNAKTGSTVTHPAVKIAEAAGRDLLRYAQEFGLTPAAELNLAKPPRPDAGDDDPFGA